MKTTLQTTIKRLKLRFKTRLRLMVLFVMFFSLAKAQHYIISTVAGDGTFGNSGDGGLATLAQITSPIACAIDGSGNMYIGTDYIIRKITPAGIISTFAGNGSSNSSGDGGLATSAGISGVSAIIADNFGNIYLTGVNTGNIRKINSAGIISTFINGIEGAGLAADASGNIYVADYGGSKIYKVTPAGISSVIAGTSNFGYSGDGGPATLAQITYPFGVTVDATGNIYILDRGNHVVRKINTSGIISTVVGNGTSGSSGDGGLATSAQLPDTRGITIDPSGNLYISCYDQSIRKVTPAGIITTIAGNRVTGYNGDGISANHSKLNFPSGIASNSTGKIWFSDYGSYRIRCLTPQAYTCPTYTFSSNISGGSLTNTLGQLIVTPTVTPNTSYGDSILISINNNSNQYVNGLVSGNSYTYSPSLPIGTYTLHLTLTDTFKVCPMLFPQVFSVNQSSVICPTVNVTTNVVGSLLNDPNGTFSLTAIATPSSSTGYFSGYLVNNGINGCYSTSGATYTLTPTSPNYTIALGLGSTIYTMNYTDPTINTFCPSYQSASTFTVLHSSLPPTLCAFFVTPNTSSVCISPTNNICLNYSNNISNYADTVYVTTIWKSGVITKTIASATVCSPSNTFNTPGVYTIMSVISGTNHIHFTEGSSSVNDTIYTSITINSCGNLTGTVYNDANNDCNQNPGELGIANIPVKATMGTTVYIAWTDALGHYAFGNIPTGNYLIQINGSPSGYTITCGNSLPHITNVSTTGTTVENFSLHCGVFDVAVTGISLLNGFFPGQTDAILPHVGILNGSCNFAIPGKVKVVLSPCLTYTTITGHSHPAPNAVISSPGGDTLIWNVADINNIGTFDYSDYFAHVTTCTTAQVGDIACITVLVLPTNGDINPANNSFTRCFTIGVSYDPNYKEVSPKGSGVEGFIPQNTNELTYTLHFQNTGTAPAHNIYLLDTLSANLDLATIEIVSSSHPVQPYLLPSRTMKFMFANIMLPDSTHDEEHSHGYITYRIRLNGSLPVGTQIKNTGYIYFDYNVPVVTNTTLNTIAIPTGLKETSGHGSFQVYPNPAKDVLMVSLNNHEGNTITITDVLGKEVIQQKTNGLITELNVSNLQSGIYFVKVGEQVHKVMISK